MSGKNHASQHYLKAKKAYIDAQLPFPASGYLFSGSAQTGKRTLADYFIAQLLCTDTTSNGPCARCRSCTRHDAGTHPDMLYVRLAPDKQEINIDQVHALGEQLRNKRTLAAYAVALIEDSDLLNRSAANALLKILEEPQGKTVFILLDNARRPLLPTIISRCQRISFQPLVDSEIKKIAKSHKLSDSVTEEIAFLSNGRPMAAELFITDTKTRAKRKSELDARLNDIMSHHHISTTAGLSWNERQKEAAELLEDYRYLWHNILLYKLGLATYLKTYHNQKAFTQFMETLSLIDVIQKLRIITKAMNALRRSVPADILLPQGL